MLTEAAVLVIRAGLTRAWSLECRRMQKTSGESTSLSKIYDLFEPSRRNPLPKATLNEVQVYLHAFFINLTGIFDCWFYSTRRN
jgi:hypothetical protein